MLVYASVYPVVVEKNVIVVGFYKPVVDVVELVGHVVSVSEEYQAAHFEVAYEVAVIGNVMLYTERLYHERAESIAS